MADYQKEMLVRWFKEVWNDGRAEAIDEMLPASCVIHDGDHSITGPREFKPFYNRLRTALSNIRVTPHEVISEGNLTCLRWSLFARHTGDGLGMPATGKEVHVAGMSMVRFENGKFAEAWQNWDMLGLLEQIRGAASSPTYLDSI
jgi:steroid delta-isomerase-like uncharacterized protein